MNTGNGQNINTTKLLKFFRYINPRWSSSPVDDQTVATLIMCEARQSNTGPLPVEIMIRILQYLVSPVSSEALAFTYRRPSFVESNDLGTHLGGAQNWLSNITLSCRSMYGVGTEFLYSRPFLPSTDRLLLFQRTLSRVPEFAKLVKEVFILDTETGGSPLSRVIRSIGFSSSQESELGISDFQYQLMNVMGTCTAAEALTINMERSVDVGYDLDKTFSRPTPFRKHLRRLVVNGCKYYTCFSMTSQISLPALEVLCLRGLYIRSTFELPHLPRLHTLQVAQVYRSQAVLKKVLDPSVLPALHTLELFQNHDMGLEFNRDLASVLPNLKCVHIIGSHYEYSVFRSWVFSPSRLDILRHLVVGVLFTSSAILIGTWRIPKMLESLSLVISLESYLRPTTPKDLPPDILACVNAFLEFNGETICEGPLRRLEIITRSQGTAEILEDVRVTSQLGAMRGFCAASGIEFALNTKGKGLDCISVPA